MQKRSLMDIEVEVENLGSHLNAYTSREMTSYYARCMGSNITKSVDILADILLNSTLDSNAIARERDVILREAKEVFPPFSTPASGQPSRPSDQSPGSYTRTGFQICHVFELLRTVRSRIEAFTLTYEHVQVNGMPEEVCMDHLHATAFQHTPLGRTILGSAQNIQSITRDDIETYIRTHYTAGTSHTLLPPPGFKATRINTAQ